MEKTEPTFVPEWLKNSGGSSTSSSLLSDEQGASKTVRNKSLDKDLGPFRRASVNNGSAHSRSYSSFNRNQRDRGRDRDRDKDIFEFRNKERLENRHIDYSDPLGNILPTRFGKNGLRRSHSGLSGKRAESGPAKVVSDLSIVKKTSFEKDFPSLGVDNDIGKVTSAIQSLPVGNSGVIGGDGWTSALAEVPVIVGSNGNGSSVAPLVQSASVSGAAGVTSGRNMAETLAHGPPRTQTPPLLTVGTQRLEELAVKQSRQLIPMTPMSKTLALNSSDKQKLKIGQSQFQSSHLTNNLNTPKPVTVKPDVSKPSTVGKLLILKPSRERNGTTPTAKDSLSPTGVGTKLPNNPPAVGPAPLKTGPSIANLEKKPSLHAQSRSNFFNLMRKKSMSNNNSSSSEPSENRCEPVAAREGGPASTVVDQPGETEAKVDLTCNGGDTCGGPVRSSVNGKARSDPDAILYPEEEEARLLRAMGWEETAEEEDEGLTEEEISSFLQNYMNVKPASKILNGTLQKQLMAIGKLDS